MTLLIEAVVFLTAAVLVVPLFRRFGLGAILEHFRFILTHSRQQPRSSCSARD